MKFATNIDLLKNELQNGVIQNLITDPDVDESKAGQIYFNTADSVLKYFDGEKWISVNDIDVLDVVHGGTGVTELAEGEVLVGNGTDPVSTVAIDSEVTEESTNLISSGAVYTYIEEIRSEIEAGEITLDDTVTEDSSNGVKSSGIYAFVQDEVKTAETEITEAYEAYVEEYIESHTDKTIIDGGSSNLVTSEAVANYVDSVVDDINTTLEETYATIDYVDTQITEVKDLIPTILDTVEEGSEDAVTGDGIYNFVTDEIRDAFEEKVTDTVEEDSDLLPTSAAVYEFTTQAVSDGFKVAEVMRFMGTIGESDGKAIITASGDDPEEINGKELKALSEYQIGWTFQVTSDLPDEYYTTNPDTGTTVAIKSGDLIIIMQDATLYSNDIIEVVQSNLDGVVIGPDSATDLNIAVFSGTSGKLIADSGVTISDITSSISFGLADSDAVTLTSSNTDDKLVSNSDTITADLTKTGVAAGEYGSAVDTETLSNGETITVPYFTVDAQGRLTIAGVNNLTLDIQSNKYESDNPALTVSGGSCTWTVEHNLNVEYPMVALYYIGDGEKDLIMADVAVSDSNTVTITINSSANITAGNYHVIIQG